MPKVTRNTYGTLLPVVLFILSLSFLSANVKPDISAREIPVTVPVTEPDSLSEGAAKVSLYEALSLDAQGLSQKAFEYAMKGYERLLEKQKLANAHILTIIDFSKPSTEKRMFVLDVENMRLLYRTYVAHGRNSGKLYATKFSNVPESNMSSLGAYTTGSTYFGQHGYSLRLNGEEKGINDNAYSRAIVIHSADYASQGFIRNQGYLGRSFGCPALPKEVSKPIINTIKEGSYIFVYAPSKSYETKSALL